MILKKPLNVEALVNTNGSCGRGVHTTIYFFLPINQVTCGKYTKPRTQYKNQYLVHTQHILMIDVYTWCILILIISLWILF